MYLLDQFREFLTSLNVFLRGLTCIHVGQLQNYVLLSRVACRIESIGSYRDRKADIDIMIKMTDEQYF